MADVGSAEWVEALARRAESVVIDPTLDLELEQDAGELGSWTIRLAGGGIRVTAGPSVGADLRLTLAPDVARAIHDGRTSPQRAFLDGQLRIGGDVSLLIEKRAELTIVAALLAEVT